MRKRIITTTSKAIGPGMEDWLDVEGAASVEMTSEDTNFPIEAALSGDGRGWRAAEPGIQTIRLVFGRPQELKCIRVVFEEKECSRTQEFVLRWSSDTNSFREIVRQQWNFSTPESTREVEEYHVDLRNLTVLELTIVPSINGGNARASLMSLRLS